MFQQILVPVDLSDKNIATIEFVRQLATTHNSEITLLHVIETVDAPFEELEGFYRELEEKAHQRLDTLAEPLRSAKLGVEERVCYGKRAREIVAFADDNRFDLIAMGSHQLTPDNVGTGVMTISHQVAIAARTPVLVLK